MYPFLAVFAGLSTAGMTMLIRAASTAPEGYEDAKGFHAVNPDDLLAYPEADIKFENLFLLDARLSSQPWS